MQTIRFEGAGTSVTVTCEKGITCSEAIETFERVVGKIIKNNHDFYGPSGKIQDLSEEAPEELTFVKTKHESAAQTIRFEGAGTVLTVTCDDGVSCEEAIETFERIAGKVIKNNHDFYGENGKIQDLSEEAPEEITFVKTKHESAI